MHGGRCPAAPCPTVRMNSVNKICATLEERMLLRPGAVRHWKEQSNPYLAPSCNVLVMVVQWCLNWIPVSVAKSVVQHANWSSVLNAGKRTTFAFHAKGQMLRIRYAEWVHSGRGAYHGSVANAKAASSAQSAALDAAQRRYDELVADEKFKAESCRRCPHCGRVVQKLEGCNAM